MSLQEYLASKSRSRHFHNHQYSPEPVQRSQAHSLHSIQLFDSDHEDEIEDNDRRTFSVHSVKEVIQEDDFDAFDVMVEGNIWRKGKLNWKPCFAVLQKQNQSYIMSLYNNAETFSPFYEFDMRFASDFEFKQQKRNIFSSSTQKKYEFSFVYHQVESSFRCDTPELFQKWKQAFDTIKNNQNQPRNNSQQIHRETPLPGAQPQEAEEEEPLHFKWAESKHQTMNEKSFEWIMQEEMKKMPFHTAPTQTANNNNKFDTFVMKPEEEAHLDLKPEFLKTFEKKSVPARKSVEVFDMNDKPLPVPQQLEISRQDSAVQTNALEAEEMVQTLLREKEELQSLLEETKQLQVSELEGIKKKRFEFETEMKRQLMLLKEKEDENIYLLQNEVRDYKAKAERVFELEQELENLKLEKQTVPQEKTKDVDFTPFVNQLESRIVSLLEGKDLKSEFSTLYEKMNSLQIPYQKFESLFEEMKKNPNNNEQVIKAIGKMSDFFVQSVDIQNQVEKNFFDKLSQIQKQNEQIQKMIQNNQNMKSKEMNERQDLMKGFEELKREILGLKLLQSKKESSVEDKLQGLEKKLSTLETKISGN